MSQSFYPKRNGDYVYDVTLTKDDTMRLSRRYRAHLSNAERIEDGPLAFVQVDIPDTYGSTVATQGSRRPACLGVTIVDPLGRPGRGGEMQSACSEAARLTRGGVGCRQIPLAFTCAERDT